MAAYTVGLVVGALTTVFPMIYMMNLDRSLAHILSKQPDFDIAAFPASVSPLLVSGITVIGAVVLLLCTAMIAITGLKQLKTPRTAAAGATDPGTAPDSDHPDTDEEEKFAVDG